VTHVVSGTPIDSDFTAIVEQHGGAIRRYVQSVVGDRADAEDLTQETFLKAYRGLPSLRDEDRLTAWLYRIATHVCYDHLRRFQRARQRGFETSPAESTEAEPVDEDTPRLDLVMEQHEMSACVRDYLDGLVDGYRAVILLHDVQGLTTREIAGFLGCSPGAVKVRLHRARLKLKAALAEACDFSRDERGVLVCEPKPPET
jgi:RNA polymerase sigma-70 factor (ECF subfamily)